MPRPQFSIRTLLWLTLVAAAFLGGIGFEKERRRREAAALRNADAPLVVPLVAPSVDPFADAIPVQPPTPVR